MGLRLLIVMVLLAMVGPWLLVGCNDPVARKMTRQREERIVYWLGEAAERERSGTERLNVRFREIERIWENDARQTRKNGRELQWWISFENRRWRQRQQPFQARIEQELAGKPQHAYDTAIRMFF